MILMRRGYCGWFSDIPRFFFLHCPCGEFQCPLRRKPSPKVPPYYVPQAQIIMEVCDLDTLDFVQYWPLETEPIMHVTRLSRDREWFQSVVDRLAHFVEIVSTLDARPDLKHDLQSSPHPDRVVARLLRPNHIPSMTYLHEQTFTPTATATPTPDTDTRPVQDVYMKRLLHGETIVEVDHLGHAIIEMEAETGLDVVCADG